MTHFLPAKALGQMPNDFYDIEVIDLSDASRKPCALFPDPYLNRFQGDNCVRDDGRRSPPCPPQKTTPARIFIPTSTATATSSKINADAAPEGFTNTRKIPAFDQTEKSLRRPSNRKIPLFFSPESFWQTWLLSNLLPNQNPEPINQEPSCSQKPGNFSRAMLEAMCGLPDANSVRNFIATSLLKNRK